MLKPLTVWIITTVENSERDGNTRPPDLPPEKPVGRKKQQLETDMEQQAGSKLGKESIKAVYFIVNLAYMQSSSCEMLGWMNHKLELRLPVEISITSDMQMIPPLWQKVKRN